jgi:hypothetical protein
VAIPQRYTQMMLPTINGQWNGFAFCLCCSHLNMKLCDTAGPSNVAPVSTISPAVAAASFASFQSQAASGAVPFAAGAGSIGGAGFGPGVGVGLGGVGGGAEFAGGLGSVGGSQFGQFGGAAAAPVDVSGK